MFHSTFAHMLVQIKEKFWQLKAIQIIKIYWKRVLFVKKISLTPGDQTVTPFPHDCVEQLSPMSVTGCDFAGSLFVEDSKSKQYILLITRAVTKNNIWNLSTFYQLKPSYSHLESSLLYVDCVPLYYTLIMSVHLMGLN